MRRKAVFAYDVEMHGFRKQPNRAFTRRSSIGDVFAGTMRAHSPSIPGILGSPGFGSAYQLWAYSKYAPLVDWSASDLRTAAFADVLDDRKRQLMAEDLALGLAYRELQHHGAVAVVTKQELASTEAQRLIANQTGLSQTRVRYATQQVTRNMCGADFVAVGRGGRDWYVCESKGHWGVCRRKASIACPTPHTIGTIRNAKGKVSTAKRRPPLQHALEQVADTVAQLMSGGVTPEGWASVAWLGAERFGSCTQVQLIDPPGEDLVSNEDVAAVAAALEVLAPSWHYAWVASVLATELGWGQRRRAGEYRAVELGDGHVVEIGFARDVVMNLPPFGRLEITMGLHRIAVEAVAEARADLLSELPGELLPGLSSAGHCH